MKHKKDCRCGTCTKRIWRLNNPIKAAYQNLKSRAKQRKKPFELSFEYFEAFCYKYKVINGKTRKNAESYTVDCIIEELGYVEGNIQPLTLSDNVKKENARRRKKKHYDWQTKTLFYTTEDIDHDHSETPF